MGTIEPYLHFLYPEVKGDVSRWIPWWSSGHAAVTTESVPASTSPHEGEGCHSSEDVEVEEIAL